MDDQFGPAIMPARVSLGETSCRPLSWIVLDARSAGLVARLMKIADEAGPNACLLDTLTLLWVVDEPGRIHVAYEEMFDINRSRSIGPHPRLFNHWERYSKLGHPALVAGGPARIGGELGYDGGVGVGHWYINNKSGRFGLAGDGRKQAHLLNVAREFGNLDLQVEAYFY